MTLESIKGVIQECIEYIEQNAVWLGIAGIAVLILLLLFGFFASAGRGRKQTKYLRQIDKKMSQVLENQQAELASREASCEEQEIREDAVELFFSETEIEEEEAELPEETTRDAAPEEVLSAEELAGKLMGGELSVDEAFERAKHIIETPIPEEPEEVPAEQPADISMDNLRQALLQARDSEPEEAAPETPEVLPDGPVARGRSGHLYTREELESQIRK